MAAIGAFDSAEVTAHTVRRLDFLVHEQFEAFRSRYEQEVPAFSVDLVAGTNDWEVVRERTMAAAPHGFLHYHRLDAGPVFSVAGHSTPCTTYLMGNHVFAEQMFRYNPAILLYAPLRVVIYADRAGATHFAVDQPSTRFASFGDPRVAAVGEMLDDRLAELLPSLGISAAR